MKHLLTATAMLTALAVPALAQTGPFPLNQSGIPAFFHSGAAACHFSVGNGVYGMSILRRANATDQCATVRDAYLGGRTITFSVTGGTIPYSPDVGGGVISSQEVGDVLLQPPNGF